MLFVDIVIYSFLGWYFDKVAPREFGRPLPFYFILTKSYWCGQKKAKIDISEKCEKNVVAPGEKDALEPVRTSHINLLGKDGNFEELSQEELHQVIKTFKI